MSYYIFNADFNANTYIPSGTTVAGTSQTFNQGDVVDASTQTDASGNNYLVTSDNNMDITAANTSPVNVTPATGATGATGMGGHMHNHGSGMINQQNADGKTVCTPCRMNAIKKFMKKQYIYAGILGAIIIIGVIMYIVKKEPIIHPVLFGIIIGISAILLLQVMKVIHEAHKLKNSLVVMTNNQ